MSDRCLGAQPTEPTTCADTSASAALVERVVAVLREEGGDPGVGLHSWRCEHPDRYGPCSCLESTAQRVLEALVPQLASTVMRSEASRLRRLADHGADEPATPYEVADYLIARADELGAGDPVPAAALSLISDPAQPAADERSPARES